MGLAREPIPTVSFVDEYCAHYRELFRDVRSFEHLKLLHLGLISDAPRKSLPAIAKRVGADPQALHYLIATANWSLENFRAIRLERLRTALKNRPFVLIIDETGDCKKGTATDYLARQYIGSLGTVERGIVSVSAIGVLDTISFPLRFEIFKPNQTLKATDHYQSKPTIAANLVRQIVADGFAISCVVADSLYGESSHFIQTLSDLHLPYVVAIRKNHSGFVAPGQHIRWTKWLPFQRVLSDASQEQRFVRECIFGKRRSVRFYEITSDPQQLPKATTRFVMTKLTGNLRQRLGNEYGLRTWIEYAYKQIKHELGWADYRFTQYRNIERWWELVSSAYVMVSLQTAVLQIDRQVAGGNESSGPSAHPPSVTQHPWWDSQLSWKRTLNNLRLLILPFCSACLLFPWLSVFPVPGLRKRLLSLIHSINFAT